MKADLKFKRGQVVETISVGGGPSEFATILGWHNISGPRENVPGYYRVRFHEDGAILLAHESGLRAV